MYRKSSWMSGHYIDNHKKFYCRLCEKEFIVGEKLLEDCRNKEFPICPYCGRKKTECTVETEDDQLEELANDLGCLGIYVDYGVEEDEWILCSDRMPGNEEEVEVTCVEKDAIGEMQYFTQIAFHMDGTILSEDSVYYWDNHNNVDWEDGDKGDCYVPKGWWVPHLDLSEVAKLNQSVIAWKPLPEPYQGNQENGCRWIPCSECLPKNEKGVEITLIYKNSKTGETRYCIARAFHTNGTLTEKESAFCWENSYNYGLCGQFYYDKNKKDCIIPEGWWLPHDLYSLITRVRTEHYTVIAWRPLPKPFGEGDAQYG